MKNVSISNLFGNLKQQIVAFLRRIITSVRPLRRQLPQTARHPGRAVPDNKTIVFWIRILFKTKFGRQNNEMGGLAAEVGEVRFWAEGARACDATAQVRPESPK